MYVVVPLIIQRTKETHHLRKRRPDFDEIIDSLDKLLHKLEVWQTPRLLLLWFNYFFFDGS